jgi:hypothetical protein
MGLTNNDLLLIVYRYVHDYYYKRLKKEYCIVFKRFFNDKSQSFIHSPSAYKILLRCCDRDLRRPITSDTNSICRIRNPRGYLTEVDSLPARYCYSMK